jgi:hypothetical protein
MRSAAARLSAVADRLRRVEAGLRPRIVSMTYAGPAADRFAATVRHQLALIHTQADQLAHAASLLVRAAADVEAQQRREALAGGSWPSSGASGGGGGDVHPC